MPRHSYENRYRAGRILRMQSDEKPQALSADAMRQRLYLLLDDPETVRKGLPGCVITQYQRCRYANCRCRRGQLHGPYYFWYGRMLGWTWKKYLTREDAPRVMALCRLHREQRWTRARSRTLLRDFKRTLRQLDALLVAVGV